MTKQINPEVAESTHLRRLATELVKESEKDNQTLTSDERSAMVDNIIDTLAQPVAILFQNVIDNEFAFYAIAAGDDEDGDDGEGDDDGDDDDDDGDGEVLEGDFTESSDAA
jgi:hypothetical protein